MALGSQNVKRQGIQFEHIWANDMDKDACQTVQDKIHIDSNQVYCSKVQNLKLRIYRWTGFDSPVMTSVL